MGIRFPFLQAKSIHLFSLFFFFNFKSPVFTKLFVDSVILSGPVPYWIRLRIIEHLGFWPMYKKLKDEILGLWMTSDFNIFYVLDGLVIIYGSKFSVYFILVHSRLCVLLVVFGVNFRIC